MEGFKAFGFGMNNIQCIDNNSLNSNRWEIDRKTFHCFISEFFHRRVCTLCSVVIFFEVKGIVTESKETLSAHGLGQESSA